VEERGIVIRGAREHNLQGFDLVIPRERLTVVTGVSGSGKSSLAFDLLFREGQRRLLETLPAFARQFAGGVRRPQVTAIDGLGPAVAVGQRLGTSNPRSTVGTRTEVWDLLRLLFARLGVAPAGTRLSRGLFSFNGAEGACPACQGLGVEDRLDPELLLADPARSLRDGALRVSTPNGYLMYSQVTLAVLDQVLRVHGGSIDQPWRELSAEVRQVLLHGSERLRVPFGKHPLESRLKWTGITARPRPDGFYRGLLPVMEEILRGKRNESILRYVRSGPCPACAGARLRPEALAVRWQGHAIAGLAALTPGGLARVLAAALVPARELPVLEPIRKDLLARCALMEELGLGYLTFDRGAPGLSRGEAQRLRLLTLALGGLSGLLVVLDEPSAGLHPLEIGSLLGVLRRLRDQGQTVVVVEHDPVLAKGADWLVDLGPGPGAAGGALLWAGAPQDLLQGPPLDTPTGRWLQGPAPAPRPPRPERASLVLPGLSRHTVRNLDLELRLGGLNVLTGRSGAGKTALLGAAVERAQAGAFQRVLAVSAEPIGRTPRSNPATYSGAFDLIRNLFAATADARARGLGKGHFSFNTAGGRCETCEGAGVLEVGMRHLGTVELPCDACGGRRFHPEVLAVTWGGRSIAEVLETSVAEAALLFRGQPALTRILAALSDCGLGHLPLGQPATTLSGGEAQRVKLATELAAAGRGPALIALDEPCTGLHAQDVAVLLAAWERLLAAGHTLLVADNDLAVVRAADRVTDLGPGAGGTRVLAAGTPEQIAACPDSDTGRCLRHREQPPAAPPRAPVAAPMALTGVTTHNLRDLDVAFPARGITVVTGPSGSGKSSLVFDTLLAEARNRFSDLVAPWARRLLPRRGGADLAAASGLRVAVAAAQAPGRRNPRSRVGTLTGVDEGLRLLFARACGTLPAAAFSGNTQAGACPRCKGLGFLQACDPRRLVRHPELALDAGAMAGTRFGAYLGEPDGQHMATLRAAGAALGLDPLRPWRELGPAERELAMAGAGDLTLAVTWAYKRGRSTGSHVLNTRWAGLARLVDAEYERTHQDPGGAALEALLGETPCPDCAGERLRPEARAVTVAGARLPELLALTAAGLRAWLERLPVLEGAAGAAWTELREPLLRRLAALADAGLGHLAADRELATLSGGEAQRVRLAAALGAGLCGVAYILDEPTRGLHPRDSGRLMRVLRGLADTGNAVVVVEHDPEVIRLADQVIELGPGAGPDGGRILAQGPPALLRLRAGSHTAQALAARPPAAAPRPFRPGVALRGVRLNNLRGFDLVLPVAAVVAVTGVSGSGKSSLVHGVLAPSVRAALRGEAPVGCTALELLAPLAGVRSLAQDPPGGSAGSSVASLAGVAEGLRRRFAATPEARALGLSARHFSTASPGGRCEACAGLGVLTVAMDLLPDVLVGCEACQGRRFLGPVLDCRLAGLDIAEVLEAGVAELAERFRTLPAIARPLAALVEVGLGYLRLGQAAGTLSAGEAQRLRLAELLQAGAEPLAVLLDEPARGLGRAEGERLLAALGALAAAGHLVVVVEHDLDLIAGADWVIDLGPGGGPEGGALLVQGPPALLAAEPGSATGQALARRAAEWAETEKAQAADPGP
jgi:excinuclease ABC subunit A